MLRYRKLKKSQAKDKGKGLLGKMDNTSFFASGSMEAYFHGFQEKVIVGESAIVLFRNFEVRNVTSFLFQVVGVYFFAR